ncbi:MAG: glycosyltransferase family 4 protein [Candidatus Omnitrophica bacterium]|jgi:glycosyltransferase involved in cell wall biosynthesis|nr:glycosyltransferase family 4 protein [Candidatus Omnitrophota bacterium]
MKVLFFVPYPREGASNRYRVEQYLPFLKEKGVRFRVSSFWCRRGFSILYKKGHFLKKLFYFFRGSLLRLGDLISVFGYDVIFVHREAYPIFGAFFENMVILTGKPVIFDFDDALFLPAKSDSNSFIGYFRYPEKFAEVVKGSAQVIAGNRYLGDCALLYNKNINIIPTPIDTEKFLPRQKSRSNSIVIGWIGSLTTAGFLQPMENVFRKLIGSNNDVLIKIVGGSYESSLGRSIVFKPWLLEEEMDDLASFDIGIMPMPDNEWTRGKCGFKAIMYMSIGIPCVCSAVGMNKEIINDGVNGYLANDEGEWTEKLILLAKNPELRRMIGENGRRTVEERYSLRANVPKFLNVLENASGSK